MFPNRQQPEPHLEADQAIQLDLTFDQAGQEHLIAICRQGKPPVYRGKFNFNAYPYQELVQSTQLDARLTLSLPPQHSEAIALRTVEVADVEHDLMDLRVILSK